MSAPVPNSPLTRIRKGMRVEPLNTGDNHPKKIYTILGHGNESPGEKHTVPKGCVLVVKSHSGDSAYTSDFNPNIRSLLAAENKEAVFDPVSKKAELFKIFTADDQGATSSHSSAIYREGDTYNNFSYQLVNRYDRYSNTILFNSGIYSLKDTDTSDTPQKLATDLDYGIIVGGQLKLVELKDYIINDDVMPIFKRGEDGLFTFNPLLIPAKLAADLTEKLAKVKQVWDDTIEKQEIYKKELKDNEQEIVELPAKIEKLQADAQAEVDLQRREDMLKLARRYASDLEKYTLFRDSLEYIADLALTLEEDYKRLKERIDNLDANDNDIPIISYFKYSNAYKYYYTQEHIYDICTVILAYINILNSGGDFNTEIVEKPSYIALEGQLGESKKSLLKKIITRSERPGFKKGVIATITNDDFFNYIPLEPMRDILIRLQKYANINDYGITTTRVSSSRVLSGIATTLNNILMDLLIRLTNTTQAELFQDVKDKLLEPGVFYNLVCRATDAKRNNRALHHPENYINPKIEVVSEVTGKVEEKVLPIKVSEVSKELRNRISESVLQRERQARNALSPAAAAAAREDEARAGLEAEAWKAAKLAKAAQKAAAAAEAAAVPGGARRHIRKSRATRKHRKYRKRKTRGNR